MKKFIVSIAVTFFCFFATVVVAAEITADNELIGLLNNTRTMQANFEQFTVNSHGVQIGQHMAGLMSLERPGKFRWEVKQPNKQLIVINKGKAIIYDIDLAQVIKKKMDYQKPGNPALLLSGTTDTFKQIFKIIKLKKAGEGVWFELIPKAKNKGDAADYQWIKMHFLDGQLTAMYIADNLDQKIEIHFDEIVFNAEISDDIFQLSYPKNVEVFAE